MNRLASLLPKSRREPGSIARWNREDEYAEPRSVCCHATFAPLHYEPGYAYPLLVWLHSGEGDERQLDQVMPLVSTRNYVAVAPRGTIRDDQVSDPRYDWPQQDDHVFLANQRVFDCIDHATRRFNVAPNRIFLAGIGSGGTMAFRVALANPDRFAGVISLGGAVPRGDSPFGRINQARRLPVLIAGGRTATRYSDACLADDLRLLHYAGMSVTMRLYPGGDELTETMLADVNHWVMDRICPLSA